MCAGRAARCFCFVSVIRWHSVSERNEELHQRSCCSITPPPPPTQRVEDEDPIQVSASEALAQASVTDAFFTSL